MAQTSLKPGELLRDAFNRVGPVFVPIALLALPANILPLIIPTAFLKATFNILFAILVGPILGGASIWLANRALAGEPADIGTALSNAWQRAGQLILTSLLLLVILLPSLALLLVPGVYLAVRLFAAQYEVMLERKSPTEALEASWNLTKGRWWQVFWPMIAVTVVLVIPVVIVAAILANAPFGDWVVNLIGVAISPVLLMAILMIYKVFKGGQSTDVEDVDPLSA